MLDYALTTTGAGYTTAINSSNLPATAKTAAVAVCGAASFANVDVVEVHVAVGDTGTWAVVRAAKVIQGG